MHPKDTPTSTTPRAAIYRRVSSSRQEERGYSLDGQLTECRQLADEIGASVVSDYRDVGSGADWDLPALFDALEAAKRGDFDILLVYDTSRLARDIGKLKVVERTLDRSGVAIRYVRQQFDDSPVGQLNKDIMAAIDSFERSNLTVRFALGKRAKVHRGDVMGQGRVPFGFRRVTDAKSGKTVKLEHDERDAAIVRRIIDELQRYSIDQVADRLTADGIATPKGGPRWSGATVYSILNNTAITGTYIHGKHAELRNGNTRKTVKRDLDDLVGVPVPAIVTQREVDAVRRALDHRKASHGRRRMLDAVDDPFTLRGILRCGECGGQLSVARQHVGRTLPNGERKVYGESRVYQCIRSKAKQAEKAGCPRCSLSWIPAEALEDAAWDTLAEALLDPARLARAFDDLSTQARRVSQTVTERSAVIEREIAKRRRAMDKAHRELVMDEPDAERERSLRSTAAELAEEINALVRSLDQVTQDARPEHYEAQRRTLEMFAATIADGLIRVTSAERRAVFEALQLRGMVTMDDDGILLGLHRYRVAWTGLIDLTVLGHHQSSRLKTQSSTTVMTPMSPSAYQNAHGVLVDGVNLKFMTWTPLQNAPVRLEPATFALD